jgi:hypothetical protein
LRALNLELFTLPSNFDFLRNHQQYMPLAAGDVGIAMFIKVPEGAHSIAKPLAASLSPNIQ